jgi:dihydroorotate dehydrogenase electron transfer subunit
MTRPLWHLTAPVLQNVRLAERTFRVRLHAPDIAAAIRPGQFLMLRWPGTTDPLLGRAFALADTFRGPDGRPVAVEVVYLVVGKLTGLLADLRPGGPLEVWGPLGNGFPDLSGRRHVALVAGGIGQTPFLAFARELLGGEGYGGEPARRRAERVSLCYGVRSADLFAGVAAFEAAGAAVHLATDDGSRGFPGTALGLLERMPRPDHIVGCGPEPMLHALARLAERWAVPCHLSLETPMACGIGVCFSCVTPVKAEGGWDYRRVCVDGPVFDAAELA